VAECLKLGIDVGSTTVKVVVSDFKNTIIFSEYMRHYSDIKNTVATLFSHIKDAIGLKGIQVAVTGSGGLLLAKMLKLDFVQEVIATKKAVNIVSIKNPTGLLTRNTATIKSTARIILVLGSSL